MSKDLVEYDNLYKTLLKKKNVMKRLKKIADKKFKIYENLRNECQQKLFDFDVLILKLKSVKKYVSGDIDEDLF